MPRPRLNFFIPYEQIVFDALPLVNGIPTIQNGDTIQVKEQLDGAEVVVNYQVKVCHRDRKGVTARKV
jgi:hypothetical protein